jgi:hypothetical protein
MRAAPVFAPAPVFCSAFAEINAGFSPIASEEPPLLSSLPDNAQA